MLLRKPRCYAEVYNDLDGEVVNLFKVLRDDDLAPKLIRQLELTPFARAEFLGSYEATDDPVERARRLICRCLMGFGSAAHNVKHQTGFRATNQRAHTTPAHDWRNYPAKLPAIIERLHGIVIECRDALEVIQQQDAPGTLFYVDPPYVRATRTPRRAEVYVFEMSEEDHRELAGVLHEVVGMVVLSGYRSDLYDELFEEWWSIERRAIGDGGTPRTEVLWLNPSAMRGRAQQELFGTEVTSV